TRDKRILILTDSLAAVRTINSYRIRSKLVWDCILSLREIAAQNQLTLGWIPGHSGIKGNELADGLAKRGANESLTGPEPAMGISKTTVDGWLREWTKAQHAGHWSAVQGQRHSKRMLRLSENQTKLLLRMSRKQLRQAIGLLTGHCGLRKHLHN